MWHEAAAGSYLKAAVTVAPPAIPLGLVAGGLAWSWRIYSMETGSGGLAPSAPAAFDQRQWRHQVRTARARISAPGSVPLLSRDGSVVAGAAIRTVRQPARPLAVIPYPRLRSHQVVLGTTGTGKTTLLLRLWAGFMTRGMQVHAAGRGPRPLLVVLDCKGGADSRRIADTARRLLGVPLWAHEGLSRAEGTPVVNPEIIRGLDVGQAAYIYRGGVTYVQIKRLVAGPAELPRPAELPHPAGRPGPAGTEGARPAAGMAAGDPGPGDPGPVRPADISALLDEAFGEEP